MKTLTNWPPAIGLHGRDLTSLGAQPLSMNVASPINPSRRSWGGGRHRADCEISNKEELVPLVARKFPGM